MRKVIACLAVLAVVATGWLVFGGSLGAPEAEVLLDVRTREEYASGHLDGAKSLPLDELEERILAELPDKNAKIAVYCRSGVRSAAAAEKLAELGYTNARDMGGMLENQ